MNEEIIHDPYLIYLGVIDKELNEEFEAQTLDYTINVDGNTNEIEINFITTNPDHTVEISDKTNNLKVGETIVTVTVTNVLTNEVTVYTITVIKEKLTSYFGY